MAPCAITTVAQLSLRPAYAPPTTVTLSEAEGSLGGGALRPSFGSSGSVLGQYGRDSSRSLRTTGVGSASDRRKECGEPRDPSTPLRSGRDDREEALRSG